ncbi:YdcH family protein [Dankookia sp. GCM10030260]|uniref:YdcH family protein n=1 Tax=Dankookia sp. GCM10030260 TaxID=3273390 RepID=UPI003614AEB1
MLDRLESLRQRHAQLDQRLNVELTRLHPNQIDISRLKIEKLRLKDQMALLMKPLPTASLHIGEVPLPERRIES